jgi:hypothetical protein
MGEYTASLIWFSAWPVLIYLSYRFVKLNVTHFKRLESLESNKTEEKKS